MATITVKTELSFSDLQNQCWSGAIDTLNTIEEHDMEDDLMYLLDELFADDEDCTLTTINDFLWFEDEYIFECLDISDEDDEDEDEDDDYDEDEDEDEEEEEEYDEDEQKYCVGIEYNEEDCIPFC